MVLSVLPDFEGATFMRREVDSRIIRRWPEVEPKNEVEQKNFTSAIAGLLTTLVKEGRLAATKGKTQFAPTVYWVIDNDEDHS